ncbi:MAG: ParB/RepB/Spo0J family partition protein [Parcubacteria group bacterium]|nr:ParB/RepB/Spo0J family partition protein [Parcubacteria group bacterium]
MKKHFSLNFGKGLTSLIPPRSSKLARPREEKEATVREKKDTVFYIETRKIRPNPDQPRRVMDPGELQELAQSIREHGILQPLVVMKTETETSRGVDVVYVLIAGERRLEAAKIAKLRDVPVIIKKPANNRGRLELALVENLQREDLNAMDRARAFRRLDKEFGLRHTEIAEKVGKSREAVSNTMRLLDLPKPMQHAIESQKISEGHARALLAIANPVQRESFFQEMLGRKMTVREAEFIARAQREKPKPLLASWHKWEEQFSQRLRRAVKIYQRRNGGEVRIPFSNEEELTSLAELFSEPRRDG